MKRPFVKFLMLLLVWLVLVPVCPAQNENTNTSNGQNTEVMSENDRLPFMQNEQAPENQEPSSGGLLLKTLGALLLIVGLIFLGAWTAKKFGLGGLKTKSSPDDLELTILSSVSLGSGRTISTVRFGGRVLLVGSTAQSFTLLAEETGPENISLANSRSVAEMLAEEHGMFEGELNEAQGRLNTWEEKGGAI